MGEPMRPVHVGSTARRGQTNIRRKGAMPSFTTIRLSLALKWWMSLSAAIPRSARRGGGSCRMCCGRNMIAPSISRRDPMQTITSIRAFAKPDIRAGC